MTRSFRTINSLRRWSGRRFGGFSYFGLIVSKTKPILENVKKGDMDVNHHHHTLCRVSFPLSLRVLILLFLPLFVFLSQSSSSLGPHISLVSPRSCSRGLTHSISISLGSCSGTLAILFPRVCGSASDRGGGRITVLAAA